MDKPSSASEHMSMELVSIAKTRFLRTIILSLILITSATVLTICSPDRVESPNLNFFAGLLSPLLMAIGGTLITAATLGYIINDKDYQSLLKEQMVGVMLNPESYRTLEQKRMAWRRMTESLLQSVLPFQNRQAVDQIEKLLLDNEREYHFEGYKAEFDFIVDEANDLLKITQIVTCSLVISPDCDAPMLRQYIEMRDEGNIHTDYLRLNEEEIDYKKHSKPDPSNPKRDELRYSLQPHIIGDSGSRTLKYHRQTVYTQSLSKEPYYCMDLTRYTKGLTIEATISKGYYVIPEGFGCPDPEFPTSELVIGTPLKKRWKVRNHNQLLLPGYSYILLVLKESEALSKE